MANFKQRKIENNLLTQKNTISKDFLSRSILVQKSTLAARQNICDCVDPVIGGRAARPVTIAAEHVAEVFVL